MIPSWVRDYIGRPWDPPQWTCWQLVRTVYQEQFDVALPSFSAIPEDELRLIEATIHQEHMDWRCVVTGEAFRLGDRAHKIGDVAVINEWGHDCHVGVMVAPTRLLHVQQRTDTHIIDLMRHEWISRVSSIHRHRRLN